jgi:hypothetical protein
VPASLTAGRRVHLELFARGRVIVVPGGIGVGAPRRSLGRVVEARCRSRVWTLDPTGVVRYTGTATLGDVFVVWGRRLAPSRLLGFRGVVRIYRNGVRLQGDPRRIALRDRDEVVLQVGPFVPPHRTYRFPRH